MECSFLTHSTLQAVYLTDIFILLEMSFLKRGRKKDKSHRVANRDTIAPVPVQQPPGFTHVPIQIPAPLTVMSR